MGRCPGRESWPGGARWNDWGWVKLPLGRFYWALDGCLPWQLQRLFKFKLQNIDGAFVEYSFPLALTTIPESSCNLDPVSKFVPVGNAPAAIAFQILSVGNIVGCAHIFPEIATSSKTGDRPHERRTVNSHIDLATWNDVFK
jgi:hypothetical protein